MSEEQVVPLRWLTPRQAGEYVKLSAKGLERLRAEGRGPKFRKVNARVVRYEISDLDAWLRGEQEAKR